MLCPVAAKPIDLLAKYISAEDDALAVEMHEPYTYLYVSRVCFQFHNIRLKIASNCVCAAWYY